MRQLFPIVLLSLFLAGCQSVAERRAQEDVEDNAECLSFGAKRGSDAYVKCRTDLQRNRATEALAARPVIVASDPFIYGGFGPGLCRRTIYGVRCY